MVEEKNELKRCFIAIEFSDGVIKEIARIQELLGKVKFTGKLTELENLHLTLKFLGEIDDEKIGEIEKKLREIKFSEMKLKLGKIGTFSIRGKPNIVWIKVEGKQIHDLQKKIDEALKDLFKSEGRFMSHLTIARIKYVKDKKGFFGHVDSIHVEPISFEVSSFKLKKSELKPIGPIYTDIAVFTSSS